MEEAYLSWLQEAPFTPAARTSTPRTSTALTLKETPTLMHLIAEDLLFSCGQKLFERSFYSHQNPRVGIPL